MPLITMKQVMADSLKKALDPNIDPKERYAVGAFNFSTIPEMVGIVEGAREAKSPVIMMLSLGALKYIGSLELVAATARGIAKQYPEVPFVLHLDHATDLEMIKHAVVCGFTNVMIDASSESFETNIAKSKEIADFAHKHSPYGINGCSVEAELGTLEGVEDEVVVEAGQASYTRPEEVEEFVTRTGCDSLAIAIGTSHGAYKFRPEQCTRNEKGILVPPPLRFDVLEEVTKRLPGFPIVLHGSSSVPQEFVEMVNTYGGNMPNAIGIPEEQLRQAARSAVCKINIDSDIRLAMTGNIRKYMAEHPDHFDPRQYLKPARQAVKDMVAHKIVDVLGSNDRI